MSFIKAIKTCLFHKYFTFRGRASRSEFWYFTLFYFLCFQGIVLLLSSLSVIHAIDPKTFATLEAIIHIALLIPSLHYLNQWLVLEAIIHIALLIPFLAATSRRLHDSNLTGLWNFLILLSTLGLIILLILCARKSSPGANRFGPSPFNENTDENVNCTDPDDGSDTTSDSYMKDTDHNDTDETCNTDNFKPETKTQAETQEPSSSYSKFTEQDRKDFTCNDVTDYSKLEQK